MCVSLKSDLAKLLKRSGHERFLLLESVFLLGAIRAAVLCVPFRLIARLLRLTPREAPQCLPPDMAPASTVGWAVAAAASRTPWQSTCLVQALCGLVMLRRRGIPCTLCLGVAKEERAVEPVSAHAWLRCGGEILIGSGGQERFTLLSVFSWRLLGAATRGIGGSEQ